MEGAAVATAIALTILLGTIYFVPAIVAFARGHHNKIAIALLNALLGWTAIGWIASLVWSATKVERTA